MSEYYFENVLIDKDDLKLDEDKVYMISYENTCLYGSVIFNHAIYFKGGKWMYRNDKNEERIFDAMRLDNVGLINYYPIT